MPSIELQRKLRHYQLRLLRFKGKSNKLPATIIGAESNYLKKVKDSGRVPIPISKSLKDALEQIAPLGTRVNDNIIGCCSEVRASNQILLTQNFPIRSIEFTDAIRPRTRQVIRRCRNCSIVFG